MDNKFDKKLAQHLRATLAQHQVPYEAGAWERFQRKRSAGRRKRVFWYRAAGIAAVLLLEFLTMLFINTSEIKDTVVDEISGNTTEEAASNGRADQATSDSSALGIRRKPSAQSVESDKSDSSNPSVTFPLTNLPIMASSKTGKNSSSEKQNVASLSDWPFSQIMPLASQGITLQFPPGVPDLRHFEHSLQKTVRERQIIQENSRTQAATRTRPGFSIGAIMSPLLTSPPLAAPPTVGWSGGVVSDFFLSKRIALSTGIRVANQRWQEDVNQMPLLISGSKALQSSSTEITSLNVPVNLRYTLKERENTAWYVSAGVSSLAYLNESFTDDFLIPRTIITYAEAENGQVIEVYETVQVPLQEIEQSGAFNQIDLAGTLNLSFGYGYDLGERWHLVLEPYYQYPISPLTSRNLSFSTSGINLRLNYRGKR